MIKYSFYKIDSEVRVRVDKPYEYLSYFSLGGRKTSEEIQSVIEGLIKVKKKKIETLFFSNQAGFMAIAAQEDPEEFDFPGAGIFIYDEFGPDDPLFAIPLDDMLQLLQDFKSFIEKDTKK